MITFYVTFGQQYPREPHPTFPAAHHDGWIEVQAEDETVARGYVVGRLGQQWSGIYNDGDDLGRHLYPLGALAAWEVPPAVAS